jgi:hypothetical protein
MTFRRPLIHFLFIDGGILHTKQNDFSYLFPLPFPQSLKMPAGNVTHWLAWAICLLEIF